MGPNYYLPFLLVSAAARKTKCRLPRVAQSAGRSVMDDWPLLNGLMALVVLVPLAYTVVFSDKLRKWRRRWYSEFVGELRVVWNAVLDEKKRTFLAPLAEAVSNDDQLRLKKSIRILEIGCGAGTNLRYYPDGASLVMVDCSSSFEERLLENVKKYPRLFLERIVYSCAQDMCEITDQSVDAVVSTNVLCCTNDERQVLAEILRVLAPLLISGRKVLHDRTAACGQVKLHLCSSVDTHKFRDLALFI
ncbi:N6-adenosine-methyltransferase TMT1A-like isoform X2 [Neocloeon triangulifer]|uniref:N6-adenosine-methyltransferase TMT1A-like isoform X2 n=1 Tax=Neocloeon triangulifer TaxID=2078957 RepID=UPI00286F507C|nr:N6-adenosine-methyltransferase TMT1A-like isoform X2 [Neocloeon triangulifer]